MEILRKPRRRKCGIEQWARWRSNGARARALNAVGYGRAGGRGEEGGGARIFHDQMATAAAIDRLVHHSVVLEFEVPSFRTDRSRPTAPAPSPPPGRVDVRQVRCCRAPSARGLLSFQSSSASTHSAVSRVDLAANPSLAAEHSRPRPRGVAGTGAEHRHPNHG